MLYYSYCFVVRILLCMLYEFSASQNSHVPIDKSNQFRTDYTSFTIFAALDPTYPLPM
jgi:hypothetical protein